MEEKEYFLLSSSAPVACCVISVHVSLLIAEYHLVSSLDSLTTKRRTTKNQEVEASTPTEYRTITNNSVHI